MNLRRLLYLLTLLALAVTIAACGGTPETPEPAAEEPAAEEAPAEEAEEEMAEEEMAEEEMMEELECSDALGCVEVDAGEPINIAYMFPTSGAVAFLGEDQKGGVEIAIDDRGGELLGHEIELTGEDSLCSAEGGQAAAQKIAADDSVTGIIGTACSSAATAALPIVSEAGLSMISSSNTAPTLTDDDQNAGGVWQPGYFRTAHNDLFQGRVAAEFAYNELGARTIATVHDGSPYADGLQAAMAAAFQELGGEVTFQGAVNVGDTDMRPILTEIASNAPDLLYFPIFEPEAPTMVAQSVEIPGLENTILFGADAALVASFPGNAGAPADGMFLSGPYIVPEGVYGELLTKWDDKFGGAPPSGFHAHAYDAANMLMDAIEAVAQSDADGNLLIGRQAIRDYLSGISGYDGVIGEISCNATGDCATGEALGIYQITGAEINDGNWPPTVVFTPGAGVIAEVAAAMGDGEAMDDGEMMADGECPVATDGDYAGLSAEGAQVEWWVNHSGGRLDLLNEILADFNATNACGIEVVANNIGGYGDISKAFNGSVAAGEVTAGLIVGYQNDQAGYQLNNALVDINTLIADGGVGLSDDEVGAYYQSFFGQSVHPLFDNQRLGFAPNRSIELLHYNATYLEELGFSGPPTTPDEFVEMACAAADASESGQGGFVLRTDASAVAAWTFAFGGELLVDGGTTYAYNGDATVAALSMVQELATEGEDGKICAYFFDGFPNPEVASRNALFAMGSSSGIPFYAGDFATINEETGGEDVYAVAAIPHTTADPVMNIYGGDVMIPVSTREQELGAWEFIKWFTSPEPQARWVEASNYFPTNSGTVDFLDNYVSENPVYGTAVDLLQYGKFEPQLPSYFPVRGQAEDAFNAILQGADVQETLDELTETANELEEEILAEING